MSVSPVNTLDSHLFGIYAATGNTPAASDPPPAAVNPSDFYGCILSGGSYETCAKVSTPALPPPASSPADPATDTGPCAGKGIIGGPLCQLGQIASNLTGIIAIALIAILLIVGLALIVQ